MAKGFARIADKGWQQIKRNMRSLDNKVVRVGVIGDEAAAPAGDGITMGELAGVHEFGAAIQQRWGVLVIPERSFIRATVAENQRAYSLLIAKLGPSVLEGKRTEEQALSLLGARAVGDMQKRIARGIDPPNAPSTIEAKGSSKPLVDEGRLRASITYAVVDKKGGDP